MTRRPGTFRAFFLLYVVIYSTAIEDSYLQYNTFSKVKIAKKAHEWPIFTLDDFQIYEHEICSPLKTNFERGEQLFHDHHVHGLRYSRSHC